MPSITWKTATDFLVTQVAAVQGALGRIIDTSQGSMTRALGQADASVALFIQNSVILGLNMTRITTSVGPDLDSFLIDFGFSRLPATASFGSETASRATTGGIPLSLPLGYILTTGPNGLQFQIIKDITNAFWDPTVTSTGGTVVGGYTMNLTQLTMNFPVQCLTLGSSGNVQANTIFNPLSPVSGVDSYTNPLAFANAFDAESDVAFRARFVQWINSRSLGVEQAIEAAINGVQQGLTFTLDDNADTEGNQQPGNFVVYVDDGTGNPPGSLITAVSNAVEAVRGFTITYNVLPPNVLNATLSMTVFAAPGYTVAQLAGPIATALETFVEGLGLGNPFPYSKIAQVVYDAAPGVANVTNILLNGSTNDIGGDISTVVRMPSAPTINVGG